jgi:hypothetical protein
MNNVLSLTDRLEIKRWEDFFNEMSHNDLLSFVVADHYTNSLVASVRIALKNVCSKKSICLKEYFNQT